MRTTPGKRSSPRAGSSTKNCSISTSPERCEGDAPGMFGRWKGRVTELKKNTYALYLAGRDPRTPPIAKLVTLAVVAYALSPVDLIPDFIPVLGYLDDLLLLPLGFFLAVKLIPPPLWEECRRNASGIVEDRALGRKAAAVVGLVWVAVLVTVFFVGRRL